MLGVGVGFLIEVLIMVFYILEEVKVVIKFFVLGMIFVVKEFKKFFKGKRKKVFVLRVMDRNGNYFVERDFLELIYSNISLLEVFWFFYINVSLVSYDKLFKFLVIIFFIFGDGKFIVVLNLV